MKKLLGSAIFLSWTWIFIVAAGAGSISPVNVDADGVALRGYDPVAYFTIGSPVKGQPELVHEWQGAKWRFSSPEQLAMFQENPAKYAPQYGGY